MPDVVKEAIDKYAYEMRKIYGTSLKKVILYGSYARGDNTTQSDIDIMLLVSLPDEEIKKTCNVVADTAFDFFMEFGIDISPVIVNQEHFNYWSDTLPFYRNVKNEGVGIIA